MHSADVAILGAGMVGVSAALHLQARGRDVVLIDRHGAAGLETSFGNAGLIERASMFPYLFPRDPKKLVLTRLTSCPRRIITSRRCPASRPGCGAISRKARRIAPRKTSPRCGR